MVTVTRKSVTPCELCGRPIAYKPGQASEALTAHFTAKHGRDLDGRRQAGQACPGGQAVPAGEPRTIRMLRALADAPGGLPAEAFVDLLAESVTPRGVTPREIAVRRYGSLLTHLAAAGEVTASGKGHGTKGRPVVLWRITDAGRRHLAAADAAPDRQGLLHDARERFGPGTPVAIRRKAAVILRGAGYSPPQIGRVFGVGGGTIRADLRQAGPVAPVPDAARALEQLAASAEQARPPQRAFAGGRRLGAARDRQDLLRDARERFGPGTPVAIRRKAAVILRGAGYSPPQIGRVFGVGGGTIRADLRQAGPVAPVPDAARALEQLAASAEQARQARQALREVRGEFGAETPLAIRREAAAILSSLGMSFREIGLVFGVTAAPIGQDLRRFRPAWSGNDPASAIRELARQAQEAKQG